MPSLFDAAKQLFDTLSPEDILKSYDSQIGDMGATSEKSGHRQPWKIETERFDPSLIGKQRQMGPITLAAHAVIHTKARCRNFDEISLDYQKLLCVKELDALKRSVLLSRWEPRASGQVQRQFPDQEEFATARTYLHMLTAYHGDTSNMMELGARLHSIRYDDNNIVFLPQSLKDELAAAESLANERAKQ